MSALMVKGIITEATPMSDMAECLEELCKLALNNPPDTVIKMIHNSTTFTITKTKE
jgi:hypothetical protein